VRFVKRFLAIDKAAMSNQDIENFPDDLKKHLHFYEHHSSAELLARFTAKGHKELDPIAKLAVAKLLFGLDKTVEDAEREIHKEGEASEIKTRSTSPKTAVSSPIELRVTDRVRLVFVPTLVENSATPDACVNGCFVYERKVMSGNWIPIQTVALSTLKAGEGFKLELHADELLKLHRELDTRYRLYEQHGIPRGNANFVRLSASLGRFLSLNDPDLKSFLDTHNEDAVKTLAKLLKWLSTSSQSGEALTRLSELPPEQLPNLNAVVGLVAIKEAISFWNANQTDAREEFWQKALEQRVFVLNQAFSYPAVVIGKKAYVGGKQITNRSGNVVDFLSATESTDAVALIEIKTPKTPLLGAEYRDGAFPFSSHLAGAITQVLRYRQSLMVEFPNITASHPKRLLAGDLKCLIIAGHSNQLATPDRRESFELQRERLQGVTVITYDELFGKLENFTRVFGQV
jgi:hypothetical protein